MKNPAVRYYLRLLRLIVVPAIGHAVNMASYVTVLSAAFFAIYSELSSHEQSILKQVPLLVLKLALIQRLFAASYEIHKEEEEAYQAAYKKRKAEQEAELAQLNALNEGYRERVRSLESQLDEKRERNEEKQRKAEARETLGNRIIEGRALFDKKIGSETELIFLVHDFEKWKQVTKADVKRAVSDYDAETFISAGVLCDIVGSINSEHNRVRCSLKATIDQLKVFADRLAV